MNELDTMNRLDTVKPENILKRIPEMKETAEKISRGAHEAVLKGGTPLRRVADFFHGTWLGHPLHAVLTDVVVGAWGLGVFFDLLGSLTRSRSTRKAADTLITIGTVSAVPTALAGFTDFTVAPRKALGTGFLHGLLNTLALSLFFLSTMSRKGRRRGLGVGLSAAGMGVATVSAWLGGELVYKYRVGVSKADQPKGPVEWQAVMPEADLVEKSPVRVEVDGNPVLLYRYGGTVYAIGAVCSHEGGPLEEGTFDGYCVECPWHQSVFDVRDGSVVHGPATYAQPDYLARIANGNVEIRIRA